MPPTLVLGGTFNPPHFGHLLLAQCALHELGAARVLLIPAGDPWMKRAGPRGRSAAGHEAPASARHRLAMVRLAVRGNPELVVDDREVHRRGPTYTVDTLEALRGEGHADLIFILGSDALAGLQHWKDPHRLLELARLAVVHKPGRPRLRQGAIDPLLQEALAARQLPIRAMPPLAISSTLIRRRVRAGLPIRYLVPDAVEAYIRRHGLYRPPG
jgi:nicotinate-nucleotide adenylyltransferase